MQIHECIHANTCIHTYIHTYIHAYIHTYIHTYTHMHLQAAAPMTAHSFAAPVYGAKDAAPPLLRTPFDNLPPSDAPAGQGTHQYTYIHTYIHTYTRSFLLQSRPPLQPFRTLQKTISMLFLKIWERRNNPYTHTYIHALIHTYIHTV